MDMKLIFADLNLIVMLNGFILLLIQSIHKFGFVHAYLELYVYSLRRQVFYFLFFAKPKKTVLILFNSVRYLVIA